MTALDDRFRALAKAELDKNGKSVVFSLLSDDLDGSTYDVNTATLPEGAPVIVPTKALIGTAKDTKGKEFLRGSGPVRAISRESDRTLFVPAVDFAVPPKAGDTVVIDGIVFTVLESDPIYSGELAAMYVVQVKS